MTDSQLQQENENTKKLFNFDGDETQLQPLEEIIKHSDRDPYYFIQFFNFYSKRRPLHQFE